MGYSIMTPFANKDHKEEMERFFKQEFRPLQTILKGEDAEYYYPPTDDLSYKPEDEETIFLGFDYGAGDSDEERAYYFVLCYWMALQHGNRKTFETYSQMPYIIYDGVEEWALFVNQEADRTIESVRVDEYGYREIVELSMMKKQKFFAMFKSEIKELERVDQAIREELIRLTKKWEEQKTRV